MLEDEFGDIISKARTGLGLSLLQISEAVGISEDELSQMENYRLHPTDRQIRVFAETLRLDRLKLSAIARNQWQPKPCRLSSDAKIEVITITAPIGIYSVHAYIAICTETRHAAIIDTAAAPNSIVEKVHQLGVEVKAIFLTHAHHDHIDGLENLTNAFDVPSYIHEAEPISPIIAKLHRLKHGDKIPIGNFGFQLLHTPGHTPGGSAFHVSNLLFVGDAIFAGSIGNPFISYADLISSVRENLLTLPDSTILFPGHGVPSTVGEEKLHNPFFTAISSNTR